jgi:3-oxoacyl-[acyl-carrier-protein] synthase-3
MTQNSVYITKAASFMPNAPVGNDDMERILGQTGVRPSRARRTILRSNKIVSRYYAIDPDTLNATHTNAQLSAEAVRGLSDEDSSLEDITCLACATTIADQLVPGHGLMVHGELGNPSCEVVTTAGVCLCGVAALKYAYMSVLSGLHSTAVATASEVSSRVMHAGNFSAEIEAKVAALEARPEIAFEKDFLRWMLSDGAGALRLESQPIANKTALKIEWIDIFSYANEMSTCMYAGAEKNPDGSLTGWSEVSALEREENSFFSLKQDVKQLNDHIVNYTIERPLASLQKTRGLNADNISYFVPHYSSGYFRDKVYDGMKKVGFDVPQERWFTNLASKGNTGSASIYIMLEELLNSGTLNAGENLLCFIPESGRFSSAFMLLTVV